MHKQSLSVSAFKAVGRPTVSTVVENHIECYVDYRSSYCDYEWKRKTVQLLSGIGVIERNKGGRNKWKWEAVETRLSGEGSVD